MAALPSSPSPSGLVSGLLSQGGVVRGLPGAPGWGTGPARPVSSVRTASDAVGPVQGWTPTQLPARVAGAPDTGTGLWHTGGERPQPAPQALLPLFTFLLTPGISTRAFTWSTLASR